MTLSLSLVIVLLVAHFVGDFICQSDWMAVNKSKQWDALAVHAFVYSIVLFAFVNWTQWIRGGFQAPMPMPTLVGIALFCCANFAAHFVQDAITSRINARLWFLKMTPAVKGWRQLHMDERLGGVSREETAYWIDDTGTRHWFFVGIGADQLLHYVTLIVTASWWLR